MKEIAERRNGIQYFDVAAGLCPYRSLENVFWNIYRMLKSNNTPRLFYVLEPTAPQAIVSVRLSAEQLLNYSETFHVMGCLSAPVHALNIHDALHDIRNNYENPFVIAVDASLGSSSHVGLVTINDGPILPGKGVKKKLPAIGDLSITGIVNVSGGHPGLLQSTRLYTVMQLADCIANALKYSIRYLDAF